jgi:geranylgeranyl pyrophosphate synthase
MILSMMQNTQDLDKYKTKIAQYLTNFLDQEKQTLAKISLDDDVFNTIKTFVLRGKMARANLLIMTYQAFQGEVEKKTLQKWLLPLAGALELIQAGLLIHDDIIDQDQKRRGQDSIWQYYALQNRLANQHYGKSQAICLGDLCFFLANQLINQGCANLCSSTEINKPSFNKSIALKIQKLINQEISQVIMAEMFDVQLAMKSQVPSLEQIFRNESL